MTVQPALPPGGGIGLILLEVEPGSAAADASLMIGDVLTGANGRPFSRVDDLQAALASGGETLELQFLRGDRRATRSTTIRLRARTPEAA